MRRLVVFETITLDGFFTGKDGDQSTSQRSHHDWVYGATTPAMPGHPDWTVDPVTASLKMTVPWTIGNNSWRMRR